MRHLPGSSASCRRAVGLKLPRYDVLESLRFGSRRMVSHHSTTFCGLPANSQTGGHPIPKPRQRLMVDTRGEEGVKPLLAATARRRGATRRLAEHGARG